MTEPCKTLTFEGVLNDLGEKVKGRIPSLDWLVGPEHIDSHTSPPCVIVEPVSESLSDAPSAPRSKIPGARYTATATVQFHCWGKTYDHALEIRAAVAAALWHVSRGSYRVTGGTWFQDRDVTTKGRVYTLSASIPFPVIDAAENADGKAVEVAGVGGTNEMEFPSGQTVVGCSS